ncbi:MAG: amidophosphoribosyltransferase [Candidatus Thermoplasmatota archaeon]|nr:amidophosphoribosyltransferase [Candidatus Thermoplasmatota archaeon]
MCGIVGILGANNISSELYTGLFAIQHRGQNGTGMYVTDGKRTKLKKDKGLVGDVFDEETLADLNGDRGIGHVRYPTIGSKVERDAQPFMVEEPIEIGMAHNGNIVNYNELIEKYDLDLESGCDLELILHVFREELEKEEVIAQEALFSAAERTMESLNGSYSVLALIPEIGLFIFRDPRGIRPLVFGKKTTLEGTSFGVSSENTVLDILGYKVLRDIMPGEAVLIKNDKSYQSKQLKNKQPKHCMFEWVYFARPDSTIERISVYEARFRLGRELAKEWRRNEYDLDVVVPVPDTARTHALALAEELDVPYREGLLRNRYVGRTFIMPDQASRETAVKTKLNPIIEEVKGKKVGLVDDSIVRGTTSKKLVKLMRDSKAEEIHFLVGCPPIVSPCYYGIDIPTKEELKAASNSIEEIRRDVGADSLTYQTIDGLVRALTKDKDELCLACLNDDYPTKVREDIRDYFEDMRKESREKIKEENSC